MRRRRRAMRRAPMVGVVFTSLGALGMLCDPDEHMPPPTDLADVGPSLTLTGDEKVCLGDHVEFTWSIEDVGSHYVKLKTEENCETLKKCFLEESLVNHSSTTVFETSPDEARTGTFAAFRCLEAGPATVRVDMVICRSAEDCDEEIRVDETFSVECVPCEDDEGGGQAISKLTEKLVPKEDDAEKVAEGEKPNPSPNECTPLSDDSECENPEGPQRIATVLDPILELSDAAVERIFGETFACGEHDDFHVLCGSGTPTAGSWVFLFTRFDEDVPLAGNQILQYAFVFDADDDPYNGWEPLPAYPKDFFAGTDLWYEALYAPASGWSLQVRDVRADLATFPTAARLIIAGSEFGILVPLSDFDTDAPTFRTTAFAHEGDYGLDGGLWSGDYMPTLEEPLLPIATDLVISVDE